MNRMDADSRKALAVIRNCIAKGRFQLSQHFTKRMDQRGLFWPDVLSIIDKPESVEDDGLDRFDRPKWIIGGTAADGLAAGVVCALDRDERGHETVFVTLYWEG